MRRGFCSSNVNENTGSSCEESGLTNFRAGVDSSLIRNQKRNFVRLVSNQVDELKKKISSITPRNQRGYLGGASRTSARSVRFRPTGSRPGFCTEDPCGSKNTFEVPQIIVTQHYETSSEPQTDYEADVEGCDEKRSPDVGCNEQRSSPVPNPRRTDDSLSREFKTTSSCTPRATSAVRRRNKSPPRGFLNDCCDVPAPSCPPANSSFPGYRPPRRSCMWLVILYLLLLLLLLAASAWYFLNSGDDSNGCSSEGTVRYVPY